LSFMRSAAFLQVFVALSVKKQPPEFIQRLQ
jgi:hypothetical protein